MYIICGVLRCKYNVNLILFAGMPLLNQSHLASRFQTCRLVDFISRFYYAIQALKAAVVGSLLPV